MLSKNPISESTWIKMILIILSISFLIILIILPAISIFYEALRLGIDMYFKTLQDEYAISAIKLTLLVAFFSILINLFFGLTASWAITKFDFVGKETFISLLSLPLAVSPVIAGLIYVLLFSTSSVLGHWLSLHHIQIIYAVPGLIIATLFVTSPYIVRELIPLMQEQGREAEQVAMALGANGIKTFTKITLPSIKWGLLYGMLICNARAMGEFGAVSVVSGHILGRTDTMPLYIELLYNDFNFVAAFTMASLLTLLAFATLILKSILERKEQQILKQDNKLNGN